MMPLNYAETLRGPPNFRAKQILSSGSNEALARLNSSNICYPNLSRSAFSEGVSTWSPYAPPRPQIPTSNHEQGVNDKNSTRFVEKTSLSTFSSLKGPETLKTPRRRLSEPCPDLSQSFSKSCLSSASAPSSRNSIEPASEDIDSQTSNNPSKIKLWSNLHTIISRLGKVDMDLKSETRASQNQDRSTSKGHQFGDINLEGHGTASLGDHYHDESIHGGQHNGARYIGNHYINHHHHYCGNSCKPVSCAEKLSKTDPNGENIPPKDESTFVNQYKAIQCAQQLLVSQYPRFDFLGQISNMMSHAIDSFMSSVMKSIMPLLTMQIQTLAHWSMARPRY